VLIAGDGAEATVMARRRATLAIRIHRSLTAPIHAEHGSPARSWRDNTMALSPMHFA
jgi:hypothetical protein